MAATDFDPNAITQWLIAWTNGRRDALDRLVPVVHEGPAPPGGRFHAPRTDWPSPAAHGPRQRSVPAARRSAAGPVAQPGPFLCDSRQLDATNPRRSLPDGSSPRNAAEAGSR